MLSWLKRSSAPSDDHPTGTQSTTTFATEYGLTQYVEEGASYVCEEPETPAPTFAMRALRSALLGTPHVKQEQNHGQAVVDAARSDQHEGFYTSHPSRIGLPPSPTKGILLTPGTGANKRKTVSFGGLMPKDGDDVRKSLNSKAETRELQIPQTWTDSSPEKAGEVTITKSLFEARLGDSKRRIHTSSVRLNAENQERASSAKQDDARSIDQARMAPQMPDTTVDLNLPCSTSGKYWKDEYEQYHRKSNRELKRIIQHGQTIRSYAQRKDSEATCLNKKLKTELAKVATMEARVSELATELGNARAQDVSDPHSPEELVGRLAKQTTLAVHYKHKAERYRAALGKQEQASPELEQENDCVRISVEEQPTQKSVSETSESVLLRKDLVGLLSALEMAEDKSCKLQHENVTMKKKLARVKEEMKSYEARRMAREERIKRREAKLISAKESCEEELANVTFEYKKLLRTHKEGKAPGCSSQGTSTEKAEDLNDNGRMSSLNLACCELRIGTERRTASTSLQERQAPLAFPDKECCWNEISDGTGSGDTARPDRRLAHISKPNVDQAGFRHTGAEDCPGPISPAADAPSVNNWAHGIQESLVNDTVSVAETPKDSGFSLLRQETHEALKQIDQNTVLKQPEQNKSSPHPNLQFDSDLIPTLSQEPFRKPVLSSAVRRMHSRRLTIASPRPSLLSFTSSPRKPEQHDARPDNSNLWAVKPSRNVSADTRTSTMDSKGGRLPAYRAEAARKRLEARKEEKRSQIEITKSST